jgi:pilus assembly protein Flp/PilA
MRRIAQKLQQLLRSEEGPTAVEYAVVLAMILLACIGGVKSVGSAVSASLENTALKVAGGSGGSGSSGSPAGGGSSGNSGNGKGNGKGGGNNGNGKGNGS